MDTNVAKINYFYFNPVMTVVLLGQQMDEFKQNFEYIQDYVNIYRKNLAKSYLVKSRADTPFAVRSFTSCSIIRIWTGFLEPLDFFGPRSTGRFRDVERESFAGIYNKKF